MHGLDIIQAKNAAAEAAHAIKIERAAQELWYSQQSYADTRTWSDVDTITQDSFRRAARTVVAAYNGES